mmetsp:Transcript_25712/g.33684  ORF Transcript_25712/g.33684 Transcript_25712/m.33684 type:complete len:725 (+) Transcript_25712:68-2242(+)
MGQRTEVNLERKVFSSLLITTTLFIFMFARLKLASALTKSFTSVAFPKNAFASRHWSSTAFGAKGAIKYSKIRKLSGMASATALSASEHEEIPVTLETLRFDNKCLRSLPIDPEERNFVRPVSNACFSRVAPDAVEDPEVVSVSTAAMALLGLSEEEMQRPEVAEYFSGNKVLPGAEPAAHCYCGHQFGAFSGQLGDGATMYLGEVINPEGQRWEIQFKGAGKTPYSRTADGRKVLRSSLREYLCSEAMFHLGVPTTRAGTIVTSDTKVMRDVFYNGNVIYEKATVILRIAETFLRFGSFEIFKPRDRMTGRAGPSVGNTELLHQMLNFAIESYFPEIAAKFEPNSPGRYLAMYEDVVKRTAELVAGWQCIGFTHGVLNTDNMSLLGLTIDYGPYGFMEYYDPEYVPNGSDGGGRYSYKQQPEICRWNLEKFAEALALGALSLESSLPALERIYWETYDNAYMGKMKAKLGLKTESEDDGKLISDLFDTMEATSADFTTVFRLLAEYSKNADEATTSTLSQKLAECCATPAIMDKGLQRSIRIVKPSMPPQQVMGINEMLQKDPAKVEQMFGAPVDAIRNEIEGEMQKMRKAMETVGKIEQLRETSNEEKVSQDKEIWAGWLDQYKERLQLESIDDTERAVSMNAVNPVFILRNWVAQEAIEAAEKGEYSKVAAIMEQLSNPYGTKDNTKSVENDEGGPDQGYLADYLKPPTENSAGLICTCSS